MAGYPDDQVVAAVLAGDSEACADFWANISERLEVFARSYRLSEADARDVVQQTLEHAIRGIRQGHHRGEGTLAGWIYGIFRHKVADFRRTNKRTAGREAALEVIQPVESQGEWLAQSKPDAEQVAIVDSALSQLPPRERAAILLSVVFGLPAREFAPLLGVPARKASEILTQARQRLAECQKTIRKSPALKRLRK